MRVIAEAASKRRQLHRAVVEKIEARRRVAEVVVIEECDRWWGGAGWMLLLLAVVVVGWSLEGSFNPAHWVCGAAELSR